MKLDDAFPELEELVRRMRARPSAVRLTPARLDPLRELTERLEVGVEIGATEVEFGRGGLLSHKGQQVILYIKDTRQPEYLLRHEPQNAKKFHVFHCDTLKRMIEQNRLQRYVVTRRADGFFSVISQEPDTRRRCEFDAALNVCKNCLEALQYEGYSKTLTEAEKTAAVQRFVIRDFFRGYQTFFSALPNRHDFDLRPSDVGYVAEWSSISRSVRESRNWRCSECNVDCSNDQHLLHTHHLDGDPRNNQKANLKPLCIECHARQPNHAHIKATPSEALRLQQLRTGRPNSHQSNTKGTGRRASALARTGTR